jgi:hypothetical protein
MTNEDVVKTVRQIEALGERIAEVAAYPTGVLHQDVCWLYDSLCKDYNKLVDKLDSNGIEHEFKKKVIIAMEPKELDYFQSLFVHHGLDIRDLLRDDDKPKPSIFGDGMKDWCGY